MYGGQMQYYIIGVDGTLAQLGNKLPAPESLGKIIAAADKANAKLLLSHERANQKKKI